MTELIGYLAAIAGSIALIPEINKALRTHHLKDMAWGMLLLSAFSTGLWTIYGFYLESYPLIIGDSVSFAAVMFLIFLKIHYSKGEKPVLHRKQS